MDMSIMPKSVTMLSKRECLDANTLIYCQHKDVKRYKIQSINKREPI